MTKNSAAQPWWGEAAAETLCSRGISAKDVSQVRRTRWYDEMASVVSAYTAAGFLIANGSIKYSNFSEGPARCRTLLPYRLWEYSSILSVLDTAATKPNQVLDIGGACSLLPFVLAERGLSVVSVDPQNNLQAIATGTAAARHLDLAAIASDVIEWNTDQRFDLITSVSVLEHLEPHRRGEFFDKIASLLTPNGLLYITFDCGDYEAPDGYEKPSLAKSVCDSRDAVLLAKRAGLELAGEHRVCQGGASPGWRRVTWEDSTTRAGFDHATPWRNVGAYVLRRLLGPATTRSSRFAHHTFFRAFFRASSSEPVFKTN